MAKSRPENDANDVINALMAEWGGVATFLHEFRQETTSLPQGHASRVKVMLTIFQLLVKLKMGGGDDQTLEEKKAELDALMGDEDD